MQTSNRTEGLTFVELLIGTAILASALLPVFDLILSNSRQTRFSSERLLATTRLRMTLDRYRHMGARRLAGMFPEDGSSRVRIDEDPLLSLPADDDLEDGLDAVERSQALSRDRAIEVKLRFVPAAGGRRGQLVGKALWKSTFGSRVSSMTASEWIPEGNEIDAR